MGPAASQAPWRRLGDIVIFVASLGGATRQPKGARLVIILPASNHRATDLGQNRA